MGKSPISFKVEKRAGALMRAGLIETPHGKIETPAFIVVGTKATVKAVTIKELEDIGAEALLANTYHLYLSPGHKLIEKAGGLHKFMNWDGPLFTDSGGFQVFSLGTAYGKSVGKIAKGEESLEKTDGDEIPIAKIKPDGVEFKSPTDGRIHFFTPEKSIEVQHSLGADIIFAFDECTSPLDDFDYQKEALQRTHQWGIRSLEYHNSKNNKDFQGIFGVIQGGRYEDLRTESAKLVGGMDFAGFGIGGSFVKKDIDANVRLVNEILPEEKPRHLFGIGEPEDIFPAVKEGCDTFDCINPTRHGRHGTLYTKNGKVNILNARYKEDFEPLEEGCGCYTCRNFTSSYISHLFRSKEILGPILASIHNTFFLVNLVKLIRASILNDRFDGFKDEFLGKYLSKSSS